MASYRSLRYDGLVGQSSWFSCGPAVLATLLANYLGFSGATEELILVQALELMGLEGELEDRGVSALTLKQILQAHDLDARGYRITNEQLLQYLQDGGLPLIGHFTIPQNHYVLIVTYLDGNLVLADPSYGHRIVPAASFGARFGFEGTVLALSSITSELVTAAREQQQLMQQWAGARQASLERNR
jgi:predicted double-glycine peptidase